MTTATIISRVWSFCTTLRDDGVGYGDQVNQASAVHHFLVFNPCRSGRRKNFRFRNVQTAAGG
jgi:hypothetical protein